ncbi:MAG: hypothetical protein V4489_08025, partial [Chlamydiota bacterium]
MIQKTDYLELHKLLNQDSFDEFEKQALLSQIDIFALGSTFYQLARIAKQERSKFPYEIGNVTTSSSSLASLSGTKENEEESFFFSTLDSSAPRKNNFAGALFDVESVRESMRSVYDEQQIDMILQMLS